MPDSKTAPRQPAGNGGGDLQNVPMLKSKASSVAGLLQAESFKKEVSRSLARQLDPDHFLRTVMTECRQTPKLFECDPASFAAAIMEMGQLGLEPGPLGHCFLLPFKNGRTGKLECTLIVGYKGVIALAWRSKKLKTPEAREVREKDEFDFAYGTGAYIKHKPNIREDRGQSYAYWARAEFVDGGEVFTVLSRSDVEKYRVRSKAKDDGPWKTDYDAMACKTAFLRLKAFLPLQPEEMEALERIERMDLGLDDGILDGIATPIEELTEEQEKWVERVNGGLPKDKQLSGPGRQKLLEDGGFEKLDAELRQRAFQSGIDPDTGEKRQKPALEESQPETASKEPASQETPKEPARAPQQAAEGASEPADDGGGLPGITP